MNAPTERDIKRLFALSGNRCAYPQCQTAIVQPSGTVTGKICHINARNPKGPRYERNQTDAERHGFNNLILLCSVHHDIVDNEPNRFTAELLREIKEIHEKNGNIELTQNDVLNIRRLMDSYVSVVTGDNSQVMIGSPGAIQAKNVTIKTQSKKAPSVQPLDAIGSSVEKKAYIEYLVKRYIEWRLDGTKSGKDNRPFHPSMIHKEIEREFGARTYLVPQSRFHDLVEYLQARIDATIKGRINRFRNYHSYEEHLEILSGKRKKR